MRWRRVSSLRRVASCVLLSAIGVTLYTARNVRSLHGPVVTAPVAALPDRAGALPDDSTGTSREATGGGVPPSSAGARTQGDTAPTTSGAAERAAGAIFPSRALQQQHQQQRQQTLLERRRECSAAAARPLQAKPSRFIRMFGGAKAPEQLRCCALVGSSRTLLGQGRGEEIDSFDTVVRVNRVPSPKFYVDFGRRADIVFVNDQHWFRPTIPVLDRPDDLNCSLANVCNFTVILSAWQPYPTRNWSTISKAWERATCAVGHEDNEIADSLRGYLPWKPGQRDHYMPSGGLHAFFTVAAQCSYTRLYGFGGPQDTADGHNVSTFHNFKAERDIMRSIGNGETKQLKRRLKNAKKSRQYVPGWLQKHLEKLSGRIAITVE